MAKAGLGAEFNAGISQDKDQDRGKVKVHTFVSEGMGFQYFSLVSRLSIKCWSDSTVPFRRIIPCLLCWGKETLKFQGEPGMRQVQGVGVCGELVWFVTMQTGYPRAAPTIMGAPSTLGFFSAAVLNALTTLPTLYSHPGQFLVLLLRTPGLFFLKDVTSF